MKQTSFNITALIVLLASLLLSGIPARAQAPDPVVVSDFQDNLDRNRFPKSDVQKWDETMQAGGYNLIEKDNGIKDITSEIVVNFQSTAAATATLTIFIGTGHSIDQNCNPGPNNDPGKWICDQDGQTKEIVGVDSNGEHVGVTEDRGTDLAYTQTYTISLVAGTNMLRFYQANPQTNGVNSVFFGFRVDPMEPEAPPTFCMQTIELAPSAWSTWVLNPSTNLEESFRTISIVDATDQSYVCDTRVETQTRPAQPQPDPEVCPNGASPDRHGRCYTTFVPTIWNQQTAPKPDPECVTDTNSLTASWIDDANQRVTIPAGQIGLYEPSQRVTFSVNTTCSEVYWEIRHANGPESEVTFHNNFFNRTFYPGTDAFYYVGNGPSTWDATFHFTGDYPVVQVLQVVVRGTD